MSDKAGEDRLLDWIHRNYRVAAVDMTDSELADLKSREDEVIVALRPYATDRTPSPLRAEVFEPGRAALTAQARERLLAGDLLGLSHHRSPA